jgi:hypothetical protein
LPLTNTEKQARWREKHVIKRHGVQRIASILLRGSWDDEHFETLGALLRSMMNREAIRALRRALKEPTREETDARHRENEKAFRDWWLREHPGRTRAEYNRLLRDDNSEVWDWRRTKGKASIAAERRDWERDHPGEEWQEHQCGMTNREYTDYQRWLRRRARRSASPRR